MPQKDQTCAGDQALLVHCAGDQALLVHCAGDWTDHLPASPAPGWGHRHLFGSVQVRQDNGLAQFRSGKTSVWLSAGQARQVFGSVQVRQDKCLAQCRSGKTSVWLMAGQARQVFGSVQVRQDNCLAQFRSGKTIIWLSAGQAGDLDSWLKGCVVVVLIPLIRLS